MGGAIDVAEFTRPPITETRFECSGEHFLLCDVSDESFIGAGRHCNAEQGVANHRLSFYTAADGGTIVRVYMHLDEGGELSYAGARLILDQGGDLRSGGARSAVDDEDVIDATRGVLAIERTDGADCVAGYLEVEFGPSFAAAGTFRSNGCFR